MNKKSNIIVGTVLVGLVGAAVIGMSIFGGSGKGSEQAARVESTRAVAVPDPKAAQAAQVEENASSTGRQSGSFVASKNGSKYFPSTCGSAKTIKEENLIYFATEAEAQQAGYERTTTCK
jgi:DNA/RNA endonuclease YhcR with UshA esterase domain